MLHPNFNQKVLGHPGEHDPILCRGPFRFIGLGNGGPIFRKLIRAIITEDVPSIEKQFAHLRGFNLVLARVAGHPIDEYPASLRALQGGADKMPLVRILGRDIRPRVI